MSQLTLPFPYFSLKYFFHSSPKIGFFESLVPLFPPAVLVFSGEVSVFDSAVLAAFAACFASYNPLAFAAYFHAPIRDSIPNTISKATNFQL